MTREYKRRGQAPAEQRDDNNDSVGVYIPNYEYQESPPSVNYPNGRYSP